MRELEGPASATEMALEIAFMRARKSTSGTDKAPVQYVYRLLYIESYIEIFLCMYTYGPMCMTQLIVC